MKRFVWAIVAAGVLMLTGPVDVAQGAANAPQTGKKRIVLRGVVCSADSMEGCPEARTVLDEAIRILKEEVQGPAILRAEHEQDLTAWESTEAASLPSASAVQSYLTAAGIKSERLEIQGFGEPQLTQK